MMIPYIIKTKLSSEELDNYGKKIDNKEINPLVFLANEDVENGINDECGAEIDDFTSVFFINADYIDKIKKFFTESGSPIEILPINEFIINNKLSFVKKDDGFDELFQNYYLKLFSFDDIFNKLADNGIQSLNEYDKIILETKNPLK